ncbi:hypothetical protein CKO28_01615 [Rhodovibrio sodomensis]|uniref:Uncharacterized protein n=1 Tax=Rhodovibrio sodomensis TaxID=1088 RepID=A0ABS1D9Z0_9PROT|nr:hypothetical protein [Rhodovibrio sodomensis]MBK1666742.1 hypothetical protein [Rhodovibrio sodomensis]
MTITSKRRMIGEPLCPCNSAPRRLCPSPNDAASCACNPRRDTGPGKVDPVLMQRIQDRRLSSPAARAILAASGRSNTALDETSARDSGAAHPDAAHPEAAHPEAAE